VYNASLNLKKIFDRKWQVKKKISKVLEI
jgi:hypothetical protein